MNIGGTRPRKDEGRIMHDCMDIGGRALSGTNAEEQLSRVKWALHVRA